MSDQLRYVVAHGVATPPKWKPITTHAVIDGTQRKPSSGFGLRASSICGRNVRLGKTATEFDKASQYACKTCVRLINNPPKTPEGANP